MLQFFINKVTSCNISLHRIKYIVIKGAIKEIHFVVHFIVLVHLLVGLVF